MHSCEPVDIVTTTGDPPVETGTLTCSQMLRIYSSFGKCIVNFTEHMSLISTMFNYPNTFNALYALYVNSA